MKRIALAGIVVIVASVLAGCGDEKAALSEEEFLRQGNAICSDGNDKLDAASEAVFGDLEGDQQPDPDELATFFSDEFIPIIQAQIDGIGELAAPKEIADDVDQLKVDAQAVLDGIEAQVKDDPLSFFEQEEDPFADVNAKAGEIGLTECAEPSEDGGDPEAVADIEPDPDHPYCDVEREIDGTFEEAFGSLGDDATEQEQQATSQTVAKQIIDDGLLDRGAAAVPDAIRADFEALAAAVRQVAEGNFAAFEDEATDLAAQRVDVFCGQS